MSRFVLITPNTEFERRVRMATAGMTGSLQFFQADYLPQSPEEVLRQMLGEPPEVFILGPGLPSEDALKFASVMDLQYPEISLILAAGDSPDLAIQAMRAGIRDLLDPSAEADHIRIIVERASLASAGRRRGLAPSSSEHKEHAAGGRIIAVISPKGGVGKTTVATNIAVGLGQIAPMGVVIVDLDLQFGDVASGLMLEPEHTITDAVVGAASQDSMVLKTYLTLHPAGIYALCAPKNPVEMDRISGEHVSHLLSQLRQEFQYVVVDTAPGLGEHVLATLDLASDAVWICGMDVPSIRGLRTGNQILAELGLLPETRHVVLNMADRRSGLTLRDVEATIGAPVDIVLPRSRNLPFSTNKGVPLLQDNNRDPATKGLRQLVERFKPNWEARPHKKLHRRAVVQ
ncbi:putative flp pilus assembly protein CpaE [Pseudarthrobacter chlorophenolicus A6]|uniref:Flp pilus assembly protein CpaE n=1 Tax=Pseudarthrobacter chlorophenolicus (strain ATCC 700700 / DSM 12829 / CIP 107037 / JCM 12360 / KCTC 9906 / NCIMB 13794 / A6) TaxID=452863 RepID=B8HCI7_PSECP|nr:AAA family ATPase [Pseudarthrobacter chlorophenolicus]ACL40603.1 putative flp pilus assembly protein CpaE [Pseudarthrobacter chlorophenolicus A6]SDQ78489.1 pilus assembly protein CpaE [Pseudarthrobacter chlorophenolicus]